MQGTRRDFIRTLLAASGSVLLSWRDVAALGDARDKPITTRSLEFSRAHAALRDGKPVPATSTTQTVDVVVIGGGAAGLAAAWQLKRAGHNVLVIENEQHAGGVMNGPFITSGGTSYPLGSTYFYRYSGVIKDFLESIGVHPIETGEDALLLKGEVVVDWWNPANISRLPIPEAEREVLKKFRSVLLSTPLPQYPLTSSSQEMVELYGGLSVRDYLGNYPSQTLAEIMDLYCQSVLGGSSREVSAYALLNFYALEFGDSFQIPCHTFPGGLGAIARKAEAWLGKEHFVGNSLAVSVESTDAGVSVACVDAVTGEVSQVRARSAIVAVPKPIARHIVRGLPRMQQEAMGTVRYAPYVTVGLVCRAPLFPERAFDFWIGDKERRFTDIIDATSPKDAMEGKLARTSGEFVYMVSCPRPASDRKKLEDMAWLATFAQNTAHAVAEHVPGALEKIVEMHVFGWGHSMVVPEVGAIAKLVPTINQNVGRIHFAHSDNDLAPAIENAMDAGFAAAQRVLRDL